MSRFDGFRDEKPPTVRTLSPNASILPKTNSEKLMYLIKRTGMEQEIAREFLDSNGWNVNEALDGFRKLVLHEEKQDQSSMSTLDIEKRKVSRGFSLSNFHLIQDEREKQKNSSLSKNGRSFIV